MLNYFHVSNYRQWKSKLDLRAQIGLLRATADRFSESEKAASDSEISDEVDQGLISLVDRSTTTIIYTIHTTRDFGGYYGGSKLKKTNRGHAILVLQAPAR